MEITSEAVLEFWFPPKPYSAAELSAAGKLWFYPAPEQNQQVIDRFSGAVNEAMSGELDHWDTTAAGRLALILLLDQFTRCIYRGSAEAFCGDAKALALTLSGIASGQHRTLDPIQQQFYLMPLQHSEDLALQEQSLKLFTELAKLGKNAEKNTLKGAQDYAQLHRDIIAKFGRFPYRNKVLGRTNTVAENEYLANDGPTFGQ